MKPMSQFNRFGEPAFDGGVEIHCARYLIPFAARLPG
jgi:hypothetical protein